jgi:hypothetical protein
MCAAHASVFKDEGAVKRERANGLYIRTGPNYFLFFFKRSDAIIVE